MFFFNVTDVHIEERLSISLPVQLLSTVTDFGFQFGNFLYVIDFCFVRGRIWVTSKKISGSSLKLRYVNHKNESSSQDSEFDSLCLSDTGLAALGDRFPKLEKLRLIWYYNVTIHELLSPTWKCVYLKALDLRVNLLSFIFLEHS
ncbi:hypothetical protein RYX36_007391 [Vicia faba]